MTDRDTHRSPAISPEWTLSRRSNAGAVTVLLEQRDPVDLRLSIDLGFAAIVAVGVEDVSDLVAGFSMADQGRVACHRYTFVLDEFGKGEDRCVVYRDKDAEVRMTRSDYDRIADIIADFLADLHVQFLIERAYTVHAMAARAGAWQSFQDEA
jgi:hypothetical protein